MSNQQAAFYGSVEEYVKTRGGNRPIKKILVANNGIGAVKAIRSMRKWSYETFGKERAVQFVAMATPEDLRANAEYIRMADEVVDVPGGNNSNNYANVMLIVEIAERWRVDAVWAGWGHASENPLLPDTLAATARKIVFIGPSGPPMRALGDKIGSTIIAQSAGVPTIAWNGDGLRADYADGGIPDDVYAKANVTSAAQAAQECARIGFPVMIKASEGGGGKGIRMVAEAEGVAAAYRQVASEVAGSPIFVMRLAPRSRHLEVQLLADTYGEAIALNGRDCSVQRRHQKIIEEGPPVVASPQVWSNMERSAVQLAKKVGYCNAGTVEYLYSMDNQDFFFLELNPRLQVEHTVTEMITKMNLPAAQLQVAMGLPLYMIPDVRRMYGREAYGTDHIDFENEERPPAQGHCIAVRITAENPDQGFQPTSGTIRELNFRSTPDVWGYFSVDSSGLVHEFADSQFGHLFARGADRETARRHMTVALKELSIRGDIRTTVEYIGEVLQSPDFISNRIDTGWLDVRIAAAKGGSLLATRMRKVDSHLAVVAGAVILAHEDVEKRTQTFLEMLGKGLLPPKELLATSKSVDLIYEGVKYSLTCCQAGPRLFTVTTTTPKCKGQGSLSEEGKGLVEAQCRPLADGGYLLVIAGKSQVVYANQEASGLRLSVNGNTCVFTKEYDPACLDTDVAGKLARRVVADGARVKEGEAYCEVEVMKMYMPLCVRESGIVRWHLSEGAALKPGDRLATLELDDPSAVTRAEVFEGSLSPSLTLETAASSDDGSRSGDTSASATTTLVAADGGDGEGEGDSASSVGGDRPHVVLRNAMDTLQVLLSGYAVPEMQCLRAISSMRTSLADDLLPYHELKEVLSVLSGRLDGDLAKKLGTLAEKYKAGCSNRSDVNCCDGDTDGDGAAAPAAASAVPLFPAGEALSLLDAHANSIADERDRAAFWTTAGDLAKVLFQHVQGPAGRASAALLRLIRDYLNVERSFAGVDMEDSLKALRKTHEGEEAIKVYDAFRSHAAVPRKNRLLLTLLDDIRQANAEAKAFSSKQRETSDGSGNDASDATTTAQAAARDDSLPPPSVFPALDGGASVDNIADGEASRALADTEAFLPVLAELSSLSNISYAPVAARSRQLLIEYKSPSLRERRTVFSAAVAEAAAASSSGDGTACRSVMDTFVARGVPVRDLLVPVIYKASGDAEGRAALELYARRVYRTHVVDNFSWKEKPKAEAAPAAAPGVIHRGSFTFQSQATCAATRTPSVGGAGSSYAAASSFVDLQLLVNSVGPDSPAGSPSNRKVAGEGADGGDAGVQDLGLGRVPSGVSRWAGLGAVEKLEDLDSGMEYLLELFPQYRGEAPSYSAGAVNALHIVLLSNPIAPQHSASGRARIESAASEGALAAAAAADAQQADDETSQALQAALLKHRDALAKADVRRVTFLSPREREASIAGSNVSILGVYTFRARAGFEEDGLFRHIEPSHAFHLDLPRLSNFAIRPANTSQLQGGNMHVYKATPKETVAGAGGRKKAGASRYFARAASEIVGRGKRYFMERMVLEALNGIDLAVAEAEDAHMRAGKKEPLPPPSNNHIFVNAVAPDPEVGPQDVAHHIRELMDRFQGKIQRLGVKQLEVKIVSGLRIGAALAPIRVVASNPTGYAVRVDIYAEVSEGNKRVFRSLKELDGEASTGSASSGMKAGWDGKEVTTPYPVSLPFEDKRLLAQARSDTLYCFDFLELLEVGVQEQWAAYAKERPQVTSTPSSVLHSRELVVRRKKASSAASSAAGGTWSASDLGDLELVEVDRAAGLNDVGMVAWMVTLRTPEYPEGRQIVLIANDITHQAGSFGTREDIVFLLASRMSRERGLPRVYIAANSGARIGMAESLKKRFKVSWADPSDPTLGYRYLYLNREDYDVMKGKGAVVCEEIVDEPSGETRFKILDVIGEEADLGVENLQGSGRIAGETSSAYSDVFTLTLVLGRTVGIGAYLVRLGQRTIQKAAAAPILLTGYQALNTLMGREVYTSNEQLGGAGVMGPNGISHQLVDSHVGAVASALRWLSYVPSSRGSYLPVLNMTGVDDVNRDVEFHPMKGVSCDPRYMIAGHGDGLDGSWTSGFFDKGSFTETLAGWAEAVVTGRARLGGIPVGIVATEGRLREKNCPADPADVSSHERIVQQAGGVWYPDSAHKTAQAIQDLNHEGLPLMVFANWRGFSGGQRDMFDEVLKYGALIVDALVEYKQPVFVYIPPHAELRGGAWVVVDSTVNANVMEMYAANGARGGVLEANGAASIKFRDRDLLKTAHRLDPVLMELDAKLASADGDEKREILAALAERETRVIGVYRQVAVQFADLHDTPGRMEARGAVRKVVPWSESRTFFFWRLRRRLAEFDLRKQISRADPSVGSLAASALLKEWFLSDSSVANASGAGDDEGSAWEEDKSVLAWMENKAGSIKKHLEQLKFGRVSAQVSELATASPDAVLEGLLSATGGLSKKARQDLLDRLSSP